MGRKRRKLDNAALAFPAATDQEDSRVFQISCEITDVVDERILREAVQEAVKQYPLFQCVLKRGNFWFYFEKAEAPLPIRKADRTVCQPLYDTKKETLLYQITYGRHVVNLEMFHALTDGTGAIEFLSAIMREYLAIAHGFERDAFSYPTEEQQEEDSFSKYYSSGRQEAQTQKSERSSQIAGRKLEKGHMRVCEYTASAQQLLEAARRYQVSVTTYLSAAFMCSIAGTMEEKEKRRPVTLMIPINLRKFYPSRTMTNFFGWMEIGCDFRKAPSFEQVLRHVRRRFSEDLKKEQVAARMNRYVKLEKSWVMRLVPLKVKNMVLKWGTKQGSKNVTAIFSNMGIIKMPDSCKPYIRRFGALCSTDRLQMCACSYDDCFYISITSRYVDEKIQNNFFEFLEKEGITLKKEQPLPVDNQNSEKRKKQ